MFVVRAGVETHDEQLQELTTFRVFAAIASVIVLVVCFLPLEVAGPAYLLFALAALTVALRRCLRLSPSIRRPSVAIIVAGYSSLTGALLKALWEMISGTTVAFPSVADVFPFISYLLFIGAIAYVVRKRSPRLRLDPILDALVAGLSAALLQWVLVVIPFLRNPENTEMSRTGVVLFSTMSLLLVVAAVLALVAGSVPSVSNRLLAAGLVVSFATDVFATLEVDGRIGARAVLVGSALIIGLGGSGLMHPSVRGLLDRGSDSTLWKRLSHRRISVLTFALVTPPVLLLWLVFSGQEAFELWVTAVAAVVLAPLVLVRLAGLVRQNERLASQEGTLRVVGEQLVESERDPEVARVLDSGIQELIGGDLIDAGLVLSPFDAGAVGWTADLAPALQAVDAEIQPLGTPASGDLRLLGDIGVAGHWYAGLVVLKGELRGILILGSHKELGEDKRNAVVALCRQGAIALRAVERTEEEVRERSEQRFATLIENSSDIVAIIDLEERLTYVSPVAERLLGRGQTGAGQISIEQVVHPDDLEMASTMFESVQRDGSVSAELRLRHTNGTYLWFELSATDLLDDPNVNGVLLNARAIDDRKAAEELLLRSEARFRALVQNNSDLVLVIDAHERVNYASPSALHLVGEEADELFGRQLSGVFRGADVDWESSLRDVAERGTTFEFGFTHESGDWRTLEAMVTDLRGDPAVSGFVLNARDITERKSMIRHLRHQATHDSLTGLANRVLVVDELDRMLSHNSGNSSVAAICIDLDDFRDINDSLGQAVGDEVLIGVAERLRSILEFGDQAARIGADEFAVIIERAHGEELVLEVTEAILETIASPFHLDGRELTLNASAGIAVDHARDVVGEGLLRNSIAAMHEAKRSARSRVVRFEDSMRTKSSDRLELRGDLLRALGTDQFVVNYQPIVNLGDGRILGAEALVRWDHPERGRLSPAYFIPIAEDAGLIERLDAQVRRQACADLAEWRSDIDSAADLTVSVNLSVSELHSEDLLPAVLKDLRENNLPADGLVLEVTESHLLDDSDMVKQQMQALRAQGVRLSIDDFGTGYSSLGYIHKFDFDVLKIDRSFVNGLTNPTNQRIVSAVLDLAAQLEAKVIAEGIETPTQQEHLMELGCSVGQGYLYSRPVPAAQFRRLLTGLTTPVAG